MLVESIAGKVMKSAGAATVSQVWRIVVTFATHMALRRMIPPEEMGVWAWAEPLFLLLAQVRDLGVPGHVVRDRDKPFGNFLALQAGWGGALSTLVFVGAPLLALAYHDTDDAAPAVIRALCLFLFVQGLGAVPMVFFESELQVQRTIPAELARNTVFAGLSLLLAWQGHGVWSLIVAHIAAAAVYTLVLWWSARHVIRLRWIAGGTRRLVWVSLPLMWMALLEQAVLKLDTFVLGLRFPSAVVGIAGLAVFAVFFFPRLLADPLGRALYPAFVRYDAQPGKAFEAYRVATVFLAALAVPTAFFLFVNAELVALVLGGREWIGAADYLRILSLVPLVRPLSMFGLELLLTRHMDRLLIVYTLLNLVSLGGLGLFLTQTRLGANGMAVAGYFPLGILVLAWGIHRLSAPGFWRLLGELLQLDLVAALLFVPIFVFVPGDQVVGRAALSCLAGLLAVGYAWRRFGDSWRTFVQGDLTADSR
ncbi:MAG: oligosaccharide flippase family protein [Acidobacteriota bacterium]